jgi:hypothetical protein
MADTNFSALLGMREEVVDVPYDMIWLLLLNLTKVYFPIVLYSESTNDRKVNR